MRKIDWQMVEAIGTLFVVALAAAAIYFAWDASNSSSQALQAANNISKQLLDIQERQFAFPVSIFPNPTNVKVYGEYWDYSATNSSNNFCNVGDNVSIRFMIFTPDRGRIYLEVSNFTPVQPDYSALPPRYNLSSVTCNVGSEAQDNASSYEGSIMMPTDTADLNFPVTVNFSIATSYVTSINGVPIREISEVDGVPISDIKSINGVPILPPVNESLPIQNRVVLVPLGIINISGTFFDAQTEKMIPLNCSVNVDAYIKWYYR